MKTITLTDIDYHLLVGAMVHYVQIRKNGSARPLYLQVIVNMLKDSQDPQDVKVRNACQAILESR